MLDNALILLANCPDPDSVWIVIDQNPFSPYEYEPTILGVYESREAAETAAPDKEGVVIEDYVVQGLPCTPADAILPDGLVYEEYISQTDTVYLIGRDPKTWEIVRDDRPWQLKKL